MPEISQIPILHVWKMLGGPDPKRCGSSLRSVAFWRNGRGLNVSIDAERGIWHDFRDGSGGGLLALVELVLNCSKADAIHWLVDNCRLDDGRDRRSPQEREQARRDHLEQQRLDAAMMPDIRAHLRHLCDERDWLIVRLRLGPNPDLEIQLSVTYMRIDQAREALRGDDEIDDGAVATTLAIVDLITAAEERNETKRG